MPLADCAPRRDMGSKGVVGDRHVGVLRAPKSEVCLTHGAIQEEVSLVTHDVMVSEPRGSQAFGPAMSRDGYDWLYLLSSDRAHAAAGMGAVPTTFAAPGLPYCVACSSFEPDGGPRGWACEQ